MAGISSTPIYHYLEGAKRERIVERFWLLVGEIVQAFHRGERNTRIAARFPVGHSLISRIRTGRSWQAEAARFGWPPAIAALRSPSIEAEIERLGGGA